MSEQALTTPGANTVPFRGSAHAIQAAEPGDFRRADADL